MSEETVRTVVKSPDVPTGKAPYSHAVVADNLVYTAGCVGLDPTTGELIQGGLKPECEQALRNLENILKAAGSDFEKVLKVTIYLADMKDWTTVNEIYKNSFKGTDNYPARTAIQAARLPLDARIEIEAVALRGRVREGNQSTL